MRERNGSSGLSLQTRGLLAEALFQWMRREGLGSVDHVPSEGAPYFFE